MNDAFMHLHMPAELACEFLAVFSRMEYALKSTITYAEGDESGVNAAWDVFANKIDDKFRAITQKDFCAAVDYLWSKPPWKQVILNGALRFKSVPLDLKQTKAQQTLVLVKRVRNNLFHGGKHMPEREFGRDEALVRAAIVVLTHCALLDGDVRSRYEH